MQTTVLHHVRTLLHKPCTRVFSTTPRQLQISRVLRSGKLVKALWRDTRDPVWRVVDVLFGRQERFKVSAALASYGASPGEFGTWRDFVYQPDIASAVLNLQGRGFPVPPHTDGELETTPPPTPHPPSWVVLHLMAFKVRTSQHALGPLLDLTYAYLPVTPKDVQGPLLILTILHLVRFNLVVPLRRVIDTFLAVSQYNSALEFNLLLQTIAWNPLHSSDIASLVVVILKTMESRQLNLAASTYKMLLKNRFVALELTKYLQQRMIDENVVPTASHLEAYLHIFSKHGAIHNADEYYKAIHALPAVTVTPGDLQGTHKRADTVILGAQRAASAFDFLRNMTTSDQLERNRPPHLAIRHRNRRRALVDAFDFPAALSVAVRDRSNSDTNLITMFEQIQTRPHSVRLTVASYTVLIRGLLVRGSPRAVQFWKVLQGTGLPIDRQALSVGLRALTSANTPNLAFRVLEQYAAPNRHDTPGIYQLRQPLHLNTIVLNDFMVALNRIRRPDVVFKLWDHMDELYDVRPDAKTLSILLYAASIAAKMDDSFSGAMAHLALKNPFRTRQHTPTSRESIVSSITDVLCDKSGALKPYTSGIWNDQPPMDAARKIFLQAIFGNAPDRLWAVAAPAHAIRASADADGMQGMGLPRLGPNRAPFVPPPDVLTPRKKSHYPSIVVSDESCMRYLYLLDAMSRVSEVPLLLAWMRELSITPKRHLLAMALALWSEVSVQAPLIEAWSGGVERNEYTRLVNWVEDWVGKEQMPDEELIHRWRRIVAKNRELARV